MLCIELFNKSFEKIRHVIKNFLWGNNSKNDVRTRVRWDVLGVLPISKGHSLLHIVPFCEGPNKKPKGFAKQKQKT
jgi:hypothetical protein